MGDNYGCQTTWALRHTLEMDRLYAERQKNYSHANRRNAGGSVDKGHSQSGILLPLMCCFVVDIIIEGLMGMDVIHWGMHYAHCPQVLLEVCVWNSSGETEISHQSIHKSFSTGINIL